MNKNDSSKGKVIFSAVLGTVIAGFILNLIWKPIDNIVDNILNGTPDVYTEFGLYSEDFGYANGNDESIPIKDTSAGFVGFLHNDGESNIVVNDIYVDVLNYEKLEQFELDPTDYGSMGDTEKPIVLKGEIMPEKGKNQFAVEEALDSNDSLKSMIVLDPNSSDKYVVNAEIDESGVYEICLQFDYTYKKQSYTTRSNSIKFIHVGSELIKNGAFDWWTKYEDILMNIDSHFEIEDSISCHLLDLDVNGIPELQIISQIGSNQLLGDSKTFYYDRDKSLKEVAYNFGLSSSIPKLLINEKDEFMWVTGYVGADYIDVNGNTVNSGFEKDWIEYQGLDIRKINFTDGVISDERLLYYKGEKNGAQPGDKYFYNGEEFDNLHEYVDVINSQWTWKLFDNGINNDNALVLTRGSGNPSQSDVEKFIEGYIPVK